MMHRSIHQKANRYSAGSQQGRGESLCVRSPCTVVLSTYDRTDKNIEAFRADWALMINNAHTYNEPTSVVARDATQMVRFAASCPKTR